MAHAAIRGPLELRIMERAVSADDYEALARKAAPTAARIKCIPVTRADGGASEGVRVLVVPRAPEAEKGFEHLMPKEEMVSCHRLLSGRAALPGGAGPVEPPSYQGVTVVAVLRSGAA